MSAHDIDQDDAPTYEVVRFFKDASKEAEVIESGLTRDDAKEKAAEYESTPDSFVGFREE